MKERQKRILKKLRMLYPDVTTALDFTDAYQLLIATILSAQTTDLQVNKVTRELFSQYPDAEALSKADPDILEKIIRSIGLYKTKTKNIMATALMVMQTYGGQVPDSREALMTLPGVGRKTANVVLSNAYHIPAIAVDTHVYRVAKRLGLSSGKNVLEVEKELMERIPKKDWNKSHHWLIWHGRRVCKAQTPLCKDCQLQSDCQYFQEQKPYEKKRNRV